MVVRVCASVAKSCARLHRLTLSPLPLLCVMVRNELVPMADRMVRVTEDLGVVRPSQSTGDIGPNVNHTHDIVLSEPPVVHDEHLQINVQHVHPSDVKCKRFVEDWSQAAALHCRLPLVHSLVFVQ